jgi:hypothetical protein
MFWSPLVVYCLDKIQQASLRSASGVVCNLYKLCDLQGLNVAGRKCCIILCGIIYVMYL